MTNPNQDQQSEGEKNKEKRENNGLFEIWPLYVPAVGHY